MKVVILGTGSTSGTFATAGGVDGFVGRLARVRPDWQREYSGLFRVLQDCGNPVESIGLDTVWSRVDYYSKFKLILGSDYGSDAAIQVRKAIADAYSFSDELSGLCTSRCELPLKRILASVSGGDAVVSFNWDTVAELVFKHLLGIDLVQAPHPSAEEGVRLIKPHGSLSWVHRRDGILLRDEWRPLLDPMKSSDIFARPEGFAQPLILGAIPIKSELLEEIQREQVGLHETVVGQWREVVDVLSRASHIDIVGYRFPPEDAYGRFLIKEAVRRRPADLAPPSLRYWSLPRDRDQIERAFRDIFGGNVNYEYEGPVETAS